LAWLDCEQKEADRYAFVVGFLERVYVLVAVLRPAAMVVLTPTIRACKQKEQYSTYYCCYKSAAVQY